jgi:hypothetical protein
MAKTLSPPGSKLAALPLVPLMIEKSSINIMVSPRVVPCKPLPKFAGGFKNAGIGGRDEPANSLDGPVEKKKGLESP